MPTAFQAKALYVSIILGVKCSSDFTVGRTYSEEYEGAFPMLWLQMSGLISGYAFSAASLVQAFTWTYVMHNDWNPLKEIL
jgi:hypothetical protein